MGKDQGVSILGLYLDEIQKKYDVLFVVATGNRESDDELEYDIVGSPADSFRAISVSATNSSDEPASYSFSGYSKFLNTKPDFATFGGDVNDEMTVISENCKIKVKGTSFAAPIISRKCAYLLSLGHSILSIPAILSAVAVKYSKEQVEASKLGSGVVPMDIRKITELSNTNLLVNIETTISNYSEIFPPNIRLPKDKNSNYPYSFVISANVDAKLSNSATFEYVEDTIRAQFGAMYKKDNGQFAMIQDTKIKPIVGDDEEGFTNEDALRENFDKYKSRYVGRKVSKRSVQGKRKKHEIEN
jgi:hypothetical protein